MSEGAQPGENTVEAVFGMESELVHACFAMERVGIKVDRKYCMDAIVHEDRRRREAEELFTQITGKEIIDSGDFLGPIFISLGFVPKATETGEHKITDDWLESIPHELALTVQKYRDSRKRANTYFRSFLYYTDKNDVLHADIKQAGTKTGRFSYKEPNLQNLPRPKKDTSIYPVRRAFVPRDGFRFVSLDYDQMEFRMMLDESAQHDLIDKIKLDGHDPHDATSDLTGFTRDTAKTINFALLYGLGLYELALKLRISVEEAKTFKREYFQKLPMVQRFVMLCKSAVVIRDQRSRGNGWIKTWFGRRAYFSEERFSYRAANSKIQGGCADVVKIAMNGIYRELADYQSRMSIQIHDEILFELSLDEMHLVANLKDIMQNAYPHRHLPLTCSGSSGLKSFFDMNVKIEDLVGEEKGDVI
jgi:DNA polymerase I